MRTLCQTITLTRINSEPWRAYAWNVSGVEHETGSGESPMEALASIWRGEPVPLPPGPPPTYVSLKEAMSLACEYVALDFADMVGPGRHAETVARRRMVWYLVHERGNGKDRVFSWPEIARACGKSNHSTLLTSIAKASPLVGSPDLNETEQEWAQVVATQRAGKCGAGCRRILALWTERAYQGRGQNRRTLADMPTA